MYNQQGDVLLKKIDSLPKKRNFKKTKSSKVILAEGEQTGHNHLLLSPLSPVSVYENNGEVFVEVLKPSKVIHQEHNEQEINPGIYKIEIINEYNHFEEETHKVLD